MSPQPDESAVPDPGYHWTTAKAWTFLHALAAFGRVSEAARAVGMSRNSAYRLRQRLGEGSLFARTWDGALERGRHERRARRAPKVTKLPRESDFFGIGR